MKTVYFSIIAVLLFSMFPSVHGISGTAFFMKTNSTSKIYANFTFSVPNNKTWNLSPGIYLPSAASPVQADSNNMTIITDPNSFKAGKDNVTVTYTITAKNNTKGVFALFLYYCGETPLIVGLNESEVSPDIYKQFFTAGYNCPAMFDFTPKMSLIGYSNMLYKRINIDSNNTIKSVQTEGQFTNNTILKNSTNQIQPIPYSILRSASPTLTPSETQSLVKIALDIPELQKWSHDWHYVDVGFLGNNKLATGGFEWQYAIVNLKSPSNSAPIPCDNDWWAWIEIDMTTMKVVKATYPTMESHQCQVAMGGGPGTSGNIMPVIKLPLKQFKSGISALDVKCANGFTLVIKAEDGSPACVRKETASALILRGWASQILTTETVSQANSNQTSGDVPDFKIGPDTLRLAPHQLVFFMKSNSSAKIFVEYTSRLPNTGTMNSWSRVYIVNATNYTPLTTSDVAISGSPLSIPLTEGSDTTVVYTVTAKEGIKGVYWLSLAQFCGLMPIAIDIDSSHLSPSDIPVFTGSRSCPAQMLDAKILGISGGTAEYRIGQPIP
ncbi:MAG: hypothetical protein KGI27_11100 [Thaumarchaeota archaeon]|nr:hypothetical protein [Nitrososphaerota archaeon]